MLQRQQIKVYTDHKNLTRDAIGLTSNRVYQWRLLLDEFVPEIVYIKGIHNTVADAISRLEYNPQVNLTNEQSFAFLADTPMDIQCWKGFSTLWHSYNEKNPGTHKHKCNLNHVFTNHSDKVEIYPITAQEVAEAQRDNATPKVFDKGVDIRLVNKTYVVCKDGRISHFNGVQYCGTTTTCNSLDTRVLKIQFKLRCTGRE